MTLQQFRGLLERRPFVPFRLVVANGEQFEVRRPTDAFFSKSSIYAGVDFDDGIPLEYRTFTLVSAVVIEASQESPPDIVV